MKKLIFTALLSLVFLRAMAQEGFSDRTLTYPHEFQIGISPGDILYSSISAEFAWQMFDANMLGVKGGLPYALSEYDEIYTSSNGGWQFEIFDKYIFSQGFYQHDANFYIRGGVQWSYIDVNYSLFDWHPYQENGNTYYSYTEEDYAEAIERLDGSLQIGAQFLFNKFYLDVSIGFRYGEATNFDELHTPNSINAYSEPYSFWRSNIFLPAVGFSLGWGKPTD